MAKATGFELNTETGDIRMNKGDTGAFTVHASRSDGENWDEYARMLFTVTGSGGKVAMQRIYRLDDQWSLGDGVVMIEFHNDDTDDWDAGTYQMERRYDVAPIWDGTPSTARCVDALAAGAVQMVEGAVVRTVFQGTLTIENVYGDI